ncbi:MAG: hypothetical protein J5642_06030, partial [Bacteroidales bacterium]|nr:hypothetical protein [Bacteroidales bacterium]
HASGGTSDHPFVFCFTPCTIPPRTQCSGGISVIAPQLVKWPSPFRRSRSERRNLRIYFYVDIFPLVPPSEKLQ